MSTNTPNYQLLKPDPSENVNVVSQLNDNLDTIDTELKRVDDLATAATPGAWTTYVLAWTATANPAIGNGVKIAAHSRIGKTCHVRGTILMGTTTTFGTGDYSFSLPFQCANSSPGNVLHTGIVNAIDAGTSYFIGSIIIPSAATTFQITGTSGGSNWGPTVPFTWANTDRLTFALTYETV